MQLIVTKTFRIDIDQYGNHQPEYFKAGGDVIEKGKYKGNLTVDKWVMSGKFYRNVPQAIWWGIQNGHLTDGSFSKDAVVSLDEYLDNLNKSISRLEELLRGVDM